MLVLTGALVWAGAGAWRGYLIIATVATFFVYGYDKRQAVLGRHRVSEAALHLLALVGGTLGALLGQLVFRHKTRHQAFRLVFLGIVTLQVLLTLAYRWVAR